MSDIKSSLARVGKLTIMDHTDTFVLGPLPQRSKQCVCQAQDARISKNLTASNAFDPTRSLVVELGAC